LRQLSIHAVVLAKAVACLTAKVRETHRAEVVVHTDVRVLVKNLPIAVPNGRKLSINASIISWVEASRPAWLVDNAVTDRAEEVVVLGVAGVVVRIIWLRTTLLEAALDQATHGGCQCGRDEGEGCKDVG